MQYLVMAVAIVALTCAIGIGQSSATFSDSTNMGILTAAAGNINTGDETQMMAPSFNNQYIPGATTAIANASAPYVISLVLRNGDTSASSAPVAIIFTKNDQTGRGQQLAATTILGNTSGAGNTSDMMNAKAITLNPITSGETKAVATEIVLTSADQNAIRAATVNAEPANSGVPLCVGNIDGFSGLNDARAATATGSGLGAPIFISNVSRLQLKNLSGGHVAYSRTLICA